jgi:hypothetical protein
MPVIRELLLNGALESYEALSPLDLSADYLRLIRAPAKLSESLCVTCVGESQLKSWWNVRCSQITGIVVASGAASTISFESRARNGVHSRAEAISGGLHETKQGAVQKALHYPSGGQCARAGVTRQAAPCPNHAGEEDRIPVQITAHEAVIADAGLKGGRTCVVNTRDTVLSGQRQKPENAAYRNLALKLVWRSSGIGYADCGGWCWSIAVSAAMWNPEGSRRNSRSAPSRTHERRAWSGTYTGYSIGGDYANRWADPVIKGAVRYTPTLTEISLVDSPCLESATFKFTEVAESFPDECRAVLVSLGHSYRHF